ncbi:hypothetical protein [Saccharothrix australiensis]|uniref:Uncharacterized protein n=1 Tax=Saccharothrix australiensis TaxID=2072 RepID=A0A495VZT1_9PSEU|nr:hypothetical protein [Saccharothrix australiensis]RKT54962.1 hypothetical protein C8E97_3615 [Saccharothrix australiensis]
MGKIGRPVAPGGCRRLGAVLAAVLLTASLSSGVARAGAVPGQGGAVPGGFGTWADAVRTG